jgi:hypothetical protein
MHSTARALILALIAPLCAFATKPLAPLPELNETIKRIAALPPDQHATSLPGFVELVLMHAHAVPEIGAEGRQLRVPVRPPAPGGAVHYEFEYFPKDQTIRIKSLDKDKGVIAKVWWPGKFQDAVFTMKDDREVHCKIGLVVEKAVPLPALEKK